MKKKLSLHLKRIWLCFGLVLLLCFGLLSFGLKVNARNYYYDRGAISLTNSMGNIYYGVIRANYQLMTDNDFYPFFSIDYIDTNNVNNSFYYYLKKNTSTGKLDFYAYNSVIASLDIDNIYGFLVDTADTTHLYFRLITLNLDFETELFTFGSQIYQDTPIDWDDITAFDFKCYGLYYGSTYYGTTPLNNSDMVNTINLLCNYDFVYYDYIDAYNQGKSEGYAEGYDVGYNEGENTITPLNRVWNIIGGIFSVISNVMAIELFPNVPLGTFFLIPLVFGAIGFIFWIWKRGS